MGGVFQGGRVRQLEVYPSLDGLLVEFSVDLEVGRDVRSVRDYVHVHRAAGVLKGRGRQGHRCYYIVLFQIFRLILKKKINS